MGAPPLEAASVSYGHREALGGVGQPLVAAQPEGTALPVEDNAGQFGVGEEGLEDLAGYRPDADHLDLAVGVGAVHHAHEAVKMSWMAALALMPKSSSRASRVVAAGGRITVGCQFEHHIGQTLLRGAHFAGVSAVGAVPPKVVPVMVVHRLADLLELRPRELGHEDAAAGVLLAHILASRARR